MVAKSIRDIIDGLEERKTAPIGKVRERFEKAESQSPEHSHSSEKRENRSQTAIRNQDASLKSEEYSVNEKKIENDEEFAKENTAKNVEENKENEKKETFIIQKKENNLETKVDTQNKPEVDKNAHVKSEETHEKNHIGQTEEKEKHIDDLKDPNVNHSEKIHIEVTKSEEKPENIQKVLVNEIKNDPVPIEHSEKTHNPENNHISPKNSHIIPENHHQTEEKPHNSETIHEKPENHEEQKSIISHEDHKNPTPDPPKQEHANIPSINPELSQSSSKKEIHIENSEKPIETSEKPTENHEKLIEKVEKELPNELPKPLEPEEKNEPDIKKQSENYSKDEEFENSPPFDITDSYSISIPVGEGKNAKLSLKNESDSEKFYEVKITNTDLINITESEFSMVGNTSKKLKIEVLPQYNPGDYKCFVVINNEDGVSACYEILIEVS